MALAPGTRLGSYEVSDPLGEGGMGVVYRARDVKLGRDVALKVLPEAFAADPDRLARFGREAHMLAALNHPNIAAIYGIEESAGVRALVLELVDGPTLADRILQGPIALEEALPIARQVLEALSAAHRQGIVHRDLKPANIKVRPDGTVKVLDFGLAKLIQSAAPGSAAPADLTMSPTITSPAITGAMILGTAAYMAPEQVKGAAADARSDLWAFGSVLHEMLTGLRPFRGSDISETFASILRDEPDWRRLPASLPASIRTLLSRCLIKDPRKRIGDVSVALFLLDEAATVSDAGPVAAAPARERRGRRAASTALVATALIVAVAVVWRAFGPAAAPVAQFFVAPPNGTSFITSGLASVSATISPDGAMLAFTARDASGKDLLWARPIDTLTARPLTGTDGARLPFWSPDSKTIAYFADGKLLKISSAGGSPQTVCSATDGRGGSWGRNGVIVFSTGTLNRVPEAGGDPTPASRLTAGHLSHGFPSFLPDARHVLYHVRSAAEEERGVHVLSLDTGESVRVTAADSGAVYDPRSARLLFVRQGTLLAQRFDVNTLALSGDPIPVADRVEFVAPIGLTSFAVSNTGVLAYGFGSTAVEIQMAWVDRQGKPIAPVGPEGNYRGLDLAPDDSRVAAHRHDGQGGDIWISDTSEATASRFTLDASQDNSSPIWSQDGNRIVFASLRNGKWGLYEKSASSAGTESRLIELDSAGVPLAWASDDSIVYRINKPGMSALWRLPASGASRAAPLPTPAGASHAQVSTDGRWLAYQSGEGGRSEVSVQQFASGAGRRQISIDGGVFPRWRRDGRELFFMDQITNAKLLAVDVRGDATAIQFGSPKVLFTSEAVILGHTNVYHPYAVSRDGQRFLIPREAASGTSRSPSSIAVVLNWDTALK